MDQAEFVAMVAAMRQAQKDYFRSRRESALERSKALEKQVDSAIEEIRKGPSMFAE